MQNVQQTGNLLNTDAHDISQPDPDVSGIEVKGWRMLLLPIRQAEKTQGGIYIPDKALDDMQELTSLCKVLKMGDLCYSTDVYQGKPWCKVGDYVLHGRHVGTKIRFNDVPLILTSDNKIEAVVTDTAGIAKYKHGQS